MAAPLTSSMHEQVFYSRDDGHRLGWQKACFLDRPYYRCTTAENLRGPLVAFIQVCPSLIFVVERSGSLQLPQQQRDVTTATALLYLVSHYVHCFLLSKYYPQCPRDCCCLSQVELEKEEAILNYDLVFPVFFFSPSLSLSLSVAVYCPCHLLFCQRFPFFVEARHDGRGPRNIKKKFNISIVVYVVR